VRNSHKRFGLERLSEVVRGLEALVDERQRMQPNGRRAEDRFREEHHDAHSVTVPSKDERPGRRRNAVTSTVPGTTNRGTAPAYPRPLPRPSASMRIRIVRKIPAPMMDGFDVRRFRREEVYDVEPRLGRYLVTAGYAVEVRQFNTGSADR
jgi:hypothetical protein